jgi:hypothetical protein
MVDYECQFAPVSFLLDELHEDIADEIKNRYWHGWTARLRTRTQRLLFDHLVLQYFVYDPGWISGNTGT